MSARKNICVWNVLLVVVAVLHGWAQQSHPPNQQTQPDQSSQQQKQSGAGQQMPGMQMPGTQQPQQPKKPNQQGSMQGMEHKHMTSMQMNMNEAPKTFVEAITRHGTSGTSGEPNSTPMPMLMTMKGKWMFMFHGVGFLNVLQQSGPRGSDKVFSTNWWMPMAQRELGPGTFTVRAMLSFEPATVTNRFYPELFQQGETAFGMPIVD